MITLSQLNTAVTNRDNRIRLGQQVFNSLWLAKIPGIEACRGSTWDPFYHVNNMPAYVDWLNKHAVIENDQIVRIQECST